MKAYAYFDIFGVLKEFIIDPSVRQGNVNVNDIMIYMENDWNGYITGDSTVDENALEAFLEIYRTQEPSPVSQFDYDVADIFYNEKVPAMKDYDPRYFKYGVNYNFIKVTIPAEALAIPGNAGLSVNIYNTDSDIRVMFLGRIPFVIEASAIGPSIPINWSEYLYLLSLASNWNSYIKRSGTTEVSNMTWKDTANNNVLIYNVSSRDLNLNGLYISPYNGGVAVRNQGSISFGIDLSAVLELTGELSEWYNDVKFNSDVNLFDKLTIGTYSNGVLFDADGSKLRFSSDNFNVSEAGKISITNGVGDIGITPTNSGGTIDSGDNLTLSGGADLILSGTEDVNVEASEDVNIQTSGGDVNISTSNELNASADDIIFASTTFTWNSKNVATENYVDGEIDIIEGLIPSGTTTGNKLVNASQLSQAIAEFAENEFQNVDTTEYPTLEDFLASTGEAGIIYLYPAGNGEYYRYIWEDNAWVSLGITTLDLTGYAQLGVSQTWTAQQQFNARVIFTSDTNLYNTRITTNSKSYFARVGVTSNQYITYNLPFNYSDVGSQATYTLETQEHAAASFVAKSSISSALYATGGGVVLFGMGASANRIVQRDNDGQVNVPLIPTNAAHAVSKSFIDSAFTEITIEED